MADAPLSTTAKGPAGSGPETVPPDAAKGMTQGTIV
jgi:hypothetical protein